MTHCETCNFPLSACGEPSPDGIPTDDCQLCRMREQRDEAQAELRLYRSEFGNSPTISALVQRCDDATFRAMKAEAACAEKDVALRLAFQLGAMSVRSHESIQAVWKAAERALASTCGKDWLSPQDAAALRASEAAASLDVIALLEEREKMKSEAERLQSELAQAKAERDAYRRQGHIYAESWKSLLVERDQLLAQVAAMRAALEADAEATRLHAVAQQHAQGSAAACEAYNTAFASRQNAEALKAKATESTEENPP